MKTIGRTQVQELVMRLPLAKLPLAYDFLLELADGETEAPSPQRSFLQLSLDERRQIMEQQARQMAAHYEQTVIERQDWQMGEY